MDKDSVVGILYASESVWLRDLVTKELREQSRIRKLRVLDVGGGKNSWLGNLVTDVIDKNPVDLRDGVTLHQGDVQSASTWDFTENYFDFISCTHMLEDVRDPQRVVDFISKCGKAGFIAVPNRHTEVSMIESPTWLGNYHHRWILTVTPSGKFEASAKWHYLNHLAQSKFLRLLAKAISFPSLRLRDAVNQIFPRVVFDGYQKSLVADYTKVEYPELGLIWEDEISLSFFNEDWCGLNPKDSSEIMSQFLSQDFLINVLTPEFALKGLLQNRPEL